jgi:hypothetical protein
MLHILSEFYKYYTLRSLPQGIHDDLSDIRLVFSVVKHESSAMNAALSGNKRLALSETVKARIGLLKLIFNKKKKVKEGYTFY